jgi:endonuclease YncB( thermonuclease family)
MIGRVWLGDVGLHQVCPGYAWVYREFVAEFTPDELQAYLDCEQTARAERRGLRCDSDPVAPWGSRRSPRRKELEP